MKRLSRDALENLAYASGAVIEVDRALGVAVLTVKNQTYYAELPKESAR